MTAKSSGYDLHAQITALPEPWRTEFEERAAIMEYDGGLTREQAEAHAFADVLGRMTVAQYPHGPITRAEQLSGHWWREFCIQLALLERRMGVPHDEAVTLALDIINIRIEGHRKRAAEPENKPGPAA